MKVTVTDFTTNRTIILNPGQAQLFKMELEEIQKRTPANGIGYRIAPDCRIIATEGGRKRQYRLYARAVLLEVRTNKVWQFYFGFLLHSWLHH